MSDRDRMANDINQFLQAGFAAMANKKAIMCAVCNRPVERVVLKQSGVNCSYNYTVYCHGESESVSITHLQMAEMTAPPEPSWAFRDQAKRIEDGRSGTDDVKNLAHGTADEVGDG